MTSIRPLIILAVHSKVTKVGCLLQVFAYVYAGAYAETLCVQQNRKDEGEKLRSLADSAWRHPRLSLAEALDVSEHSSKVPVVDARISRVL